MEANMDTKKFKRTIQGFEFVFSIHNSSIYYNSPFILNFSHPTLGFGSLKHPFLTLNYIKDKDISHLISTLSLIPCKKCSIGYFVKYPTTNREELCEHCFLQHIQNEESKILTLEHIKEYQFLSKKNSEGYLFFTYYGNFDQIEKCGFFKKIPPKHTIENTVDKKYYNIKDRIDYLVENTSELSILNF